MSQEQDWVPPAEGADEGDASQQQETAAETRAREREEDRQALQAEFNQHKAQYGRRMNSLVTGLRNMGLDAAEDGTPVIRDPRIAAAKIMGIDPGQQQQQQPEAIPDPAYAPNEFGDWQARQSAAAAQKIADPIQRELADTQTVLARMAIRTAALSVKPLLTELGMEGAADDPAFQRIMSNALQQGKVPISAWDGTDDETQQALEHAATFAIPAYRRYLKENGKTPAAATAKGGNGRQETPIERANRQSLASIGSTRGEGASRDTFTPDEIAGAEEMTLMLKRHRNPVTPAEFRAMESEDGIRSYQQDQRRRQQPAGRR